MIKLPMVLTKRVQERARSAVNSRSATAVLGARFVCSTWLR